MLRTLLRCMSSTSNSQTDKVSVAGYCVLCSLLASFCKTTNSALLASFSQPEPGETTDNVRGPTCPLCSHWTLLVTVVLKRHFWLKPAKLTWKLTLVLPGSGVTPTQSPCQSSGHHLWRLFQKTIRGFDCKINGRAFWAALLHSLGR